MHPIDIGGELRALLADAGAVIVGYGDLSAVPAEERDGLPVGVSIAVAYPRDIIEGIAHGPTREYHAMYNHLNERLDHAVTAGADYLRGKGYSACAQTRERVGYGETDLFTRLPHKTVATRAGIGWIGKSALLVTREYGSMIRLSSILTDAPLPVAEPVNTSSCGSCRVCVDSCPGKAITGDNWALGKPREDFFRAADCRRTARALCDELLNEKVTLCGKCILVCPHTRRYLDGGSPCA